MVYGIDFSTSETHRQWQHACNQAILSNHWLRARTSSGTEVAFGTYSWANTYSSPFKKKASNVGKTIIHHPFGNGLYHLFMVIWWWFEMVHDCFKFYPNNYFDLFWTIWWSLALGNLQKSTHTKNKTHVAPLLLVEGAPAPSFGLPNLKNA